MSLLGIDAGTTGCKAALFATDGSPLASAYEEYDVQRPEPGWAELDAVAVWEQIKRTIAEAAVGAGADPVTALCVSSLGEAVVPVTAERQILGPSLLNFDARGEAYLEDLAAALDDESLYRTNGNTLGNHYSLTKIKWIKEHRPGIYEDTFKLLHWSNFVSFMLGAEPYVDYALANRTLLFDVDRETWSDELLDWAGLDRDRLPDPVPPGTAVGAVSDEMADELGLPRGVRIVSGAHDQCCNAVGCGVIARGRAVYGMGTYLCITPVFTERREPGVMVERGLNTEHHAVPGQYVCFIYNQGGALVKWLRDTFAAEEHHRSELPAGPSPVVVLPHFTATGPPEFIADSRGVIAGLQLETTRGDVLKGILEGTTFYLKEIVDALPPTGIGIDDYRAVGGGSKSDAWVQLCADVLGQPFTRPRVTEAGALGAAIMAGTGSGVFASYEEGVDAMVELERVFEPDAEMRKRYQDRFERYSRLWPLMNGYLREMAAAD
jgi:xylulokinase